MKRIAIVGSGNVATHLACALAEKNYEIVGVFGRDITNVRKLAERAGLPESVACDSYARLPLMLPDVIIVSLADNCVAEVVNRIPCVGNAVALHTSGTLPKEILTPLTSHVGILYPLQTFSKDVPVEMSEVPFFTEGSDVPTLALADEIAHSISHTVAHADAAKRHTLHIAGVLSCNFPNFLWECVERLLSADGYSLNVVEPLVRATVDKAFSIGPHAAQTGPACRGDRDVIANHTASLSGELASVYGALSEMIMKSHGK